MGKYVVYSTGYRIPGGIELGILFFDKEKKEAWRHIVSTEKVEYSDSCAIGDGYEPWEETIKTLSSRFKENIRNHRGHDVDFCDNSAIEKTEEHFKYLIDHGNLKKSG